MNVIAAPSKPKTKTRQRYNRAMKIVRRVHMYAGLLLPWVMLYGLSGMLFNHPEWLGPVEVIGSYSAAEVNQAVGFAPVDADAVAAEVVAQLNRQSPREYKVASAAVISDPLLYFGRTDQGRGLVMVSPNHGSANVRRFLDAARQDKPSFDGATAAIESFNAAEMTAKAGVLMKSAGLEPQGPLKASKRSANVHFQVASSGGRKWNVVYHLPTGALTGRASDADTSLDFYTLVTRLHMTHHYPDRVGARWLWALAADVLGATMLIWAVSGLLMWWQIKKTRVIGMVALSIVLVAAFLLITSTLAVSNFGPAVQPGPPAPPPKAGRQDKSDSAAQTPASPAAVESGKEKQ